MVALAIALLTGHLISCLNHGNHDTLHHDSLAARQTIESTLIADVKALQDGGNAAGNGKPQQIEQYDFAVALHVLLSVPVAIQRNSTAPNYTALLEQNTVLAHRRVVVLIV